MNEPEPAPKANHDGVSVWDLVIADMRERDRIGTRKYGQRLTTRDGPKSLVDAYQEALDLAVYLRKEIAERSDKPEPESEGRMEPSWAIRSSEHFVAGFTSFDLKDGGRVHIPPEQVMRMWNEEQERKAKATPAPEAEKTEPHKGGDYHYSGDGSKQFWSRVNALSDKEVAAVYALGCDLQVMEEKVLKALYAAEMATPAPKLGKDWVVPPAGAELIADERDRQIKREGWSHEHDDTHEYFELSRAACCYANVAAGRLKGLDWPWDWKYWKPNNTPVRNLVKAGALIAAEIDRLQRLEKPDSSATPAPEEPKAKGEKTNKESGERYTIAHDCRLYYENHYLGDVPRGMAQRIVLALNQMEERGCE